MTRGQHHPRSVGRQLLQGEALWRQGHLGYGGCRDPSLGVMVCLLLFLLREVIKDNILVKVIVLSKPSRGQDEIWPWGRVNGF